MEFFFSPLHFIYLYPSVVSACVNSVSAKYLKMPCVESVCLSNVLRLCWFIEYYVFDLSWAFSKRSQKTTSSLKSPAGWLKWLSTGYLTPLWRSWSGLVIVCYTLQPEDNQISHSNRSGSFVRLSRGLWNVLYWRTSDRVLYLWEKHQQWERAVKLSNRGPQLMQLTCSGLKRPRYLD